MNDSRMTAKVALRDSGTVTWRNFAQAPPSSLTASLYSSGIDRMPAMKMTSAMPTPFQTSTNATDSSAIDGSVSHCGPWMPTTEIAWLMRPLEGCISTANVMPTATVLTSAGKKMTERSRLRARMRDVSSAASGRPMATFRPLVTTA